MAIVNPIKGSIVRAAVGAALEWPQPNEASVGAVERIALVTNYVNNLQNYTFDGTTWSTEGSALALPASVHQVTATATNRVAHIAHNSRQLGMYEVTDGVWALVGSLFATVLENPKGGVAAISDSVVMIYTGNGRVREYTFDGSNWAEGIPLISIGGPDVMAIVALSPTRVVIAYKVDIHYVLKAYNKSGASWIAAGNIINISTSGVTDVYLAALSATRFALWAMNGPGLRAYDFDGTNFTLVGNALSVGGGSNVSAVIALSESAVAFVDSNTNVIRKYSFDGTDWTPVGDALAHTTGGPAGVCLTFTGPALA